MRFFKFFKNIKFVCVLGVILGSILSILLCTINQVTLTTTQPIKEQNTFEFIKGKQYAIINLASKNTFSFSLPSGIATPISITKEIDNSNPKVKLDINRLQVFNLFGNEVFNCDISEITWLSEIFKTSQYFDVDVNSQLGSSTLNLTTLIGLCFVGSFFIAYFIKIFLKLNSSKMYKVVLLIFLFNPTVLQIVEFITKSSGIYYWLYIFLDYVIFLYLIIGTTNFFSFGQKDANLKLISSIDNVPADTASSYDLTKIIIRLVGVGMFIYLLFSFIKYHYFPQYPENALLFSRNDAFMDFYSVNSFAHNLTPYSGDTSYPPFALALAYPFSMFFDYSHFPARMARVHIASILSYEIIFIPFCIFMLITIYKTTSRNTFSVNMVNTCVLWFSYPMIFLLDRGNYLVITYIFIYLFIYFYYSNKKISLWFLAAAISSKIYPILFLMLLVAEKRFRDILYVLITCCFITIISFSFFFGSILFSILQFYHNIFEFTNGFSAVQNNSYSSSIRGIVDIPIMVLNNGMIPFNLKLVYNIISIALTLMVAFLVKMDRVFWRRIYYLLVLQILLVPISPDYNLVYLYIPLLLVLKQQNQHGKLDYFLVIIIGLLLTPKSYYILFSINIIKYNVVYETSIQSFINPLLLFISLLVPLMKIWSRVYNGRLC